MNENPKPGWLTSFDQALTIANAVILTGCVRDLYSSRWYQYDESPKWISLVPFVQAYLATKGYEIVALFDRVGEQVPSGLTPGSIPGEDNENSTPTWALLRLYETDATPKFKEATDGLPLPSEDNIENYLGLFRSLLANVKYLSAVVLDHSDKLFSPPERQQDTDKKLSIRLQKIVEASATGVKERCNNLLIMVFPTEGQIPVDLYLHNPAIKIISIPKPDKLTRKLFWSENIAEFEPYRASDDKDRDKWSDSLADNTDGFYIHDLASLVKLAGDSAIPLNTRRDVRELVHILRFGHRKSPWEDINPDRILDRDQGLEASLKLRVKGQDKAIAKVRTMMLRAQTGIAGWQNPNRPKGIFFFVGPTGVGKTELAKSLANFLFGSDDAMIRFDMSEFSQEHAGERLVGAPPGYVGFEKGGQLINAVRERPFSVLLFDEIEKGHPRILDKFLQILDDGRLTDGRGVTAHFSDSVIIFTSNIGQVFELSVSENQPKEVQDLIRQNNVKIKEFVKRAPFDTASDPPETSIEIYEKTFTTLEEYFKAAVENYFHNRLQRPELLRRVGFDNIIVFNRITDDMKREIVRSKLDKFSQHLLKKGSARNVEYTDNLVDFLANHPEGFEKGGAGGMQNLISEYIEERVAYLVGYRQDDLRNRTLGLDFARGEVQVLIE